jgi:hypothetical protein
LDEICVLPFPVSRIADPSPDGRYVFCGSWKQMAILDVQNKTTIPLSGDAQSYVWFGSDELIFSREMPDTQRRGTWLKKLHGDETRITEEPFLVLHDGAALVQTLKEAGVMVFETRLGLQKVNLDGSGLEQIASQTKPAAMLIPVEVAAQ